MATKSANLYALLKVDDDDDYVEVKSKDKPTNNSRERSSSGKNKDSNKKRKGKKTAAAAEAEKTRVQTQTNTSAKPTPPRDDNPLGLKKASGDGRSSDAQWDQWRKVDAEFTEDRYEDELQQALMQSKLDFEKSATSPGLENGHSASGKGNKKKKNKKGTMSLKEFNQLPQEKAPNSDSEPEEIIEFMPERVIETKFKENEPEFFDHVKKDAQHIIRKEIIQEEYKKQYALESLQSQRHSEEIDKKDDLITKLQAENEKLKEEYKQVKKRNQQLCHILAQGEMKDKKSVLLENEQLLSVQQELTAEVASLTMELEKERSIVHALRDGDPDKSQKSKSGKGAGR